jgi:hypothetical protein
VNVVCGSYLANSGIASQHFRIGLDTVLRRSMFFDGVDFPPFCEARSLLFVALQAFGKSIQALGDQVTRRQGQGYLALVHLDTRPNSPTISISETVRRGDFGGTVYRK